MSPQINKISLPPLVVALIGCLLANSALAQLKETLPLLTDGKAPQTFDETWAGFDPREEPLDVEVLKAWEEDDVVLMVLRYRVGVFKGKKSMVAAVFGYPKNGENLPGLVQIHGGGQFADYRAVLTNAKRGYATISISWAGRISAPGYRVSPNEVKLFWDEKKDDPAYKITTDWGALDGYHAPSRNPKNAFPTIPIGEWTLDEIPSPRNNSWFLCTMAARRALTFLEQNPKVDPKRLGVYGHSMGGKLTVLTAGSDDRVKAAAPSCGGISDRTNGDPLFRATIGDDAYLKRVTCPIAFLSPANDFHGRISDLPISIKEIKTKEWRVTCSPHHNHQDTAKYEVMTQLWFDQHLKASFTLPKTPNVDLKLETKSGIPKFTVRPDSEEPAMAVDIFYTQQGQMDGEKDDMKNTKARFWHHATATQHSDEWTADIPVLSAEKPLWVYANVTYPLEKPITGAGYYYGTYTALQFNLSSLISMVRPDDLKAAEVKATRKPTTMIEDFGDDWEKEWFTYKPSEWSRKTHKVYDPEWAAPSNARLAMDVQSELPNKIVIGIDEFAVEIPIQGGPDWQTIILSPSDFKDSAGKALPSWDDIHELRIVDQERLRDKETGKVQKLGETWKGKAPAFQDLHWKN